MAPSPPSPTPPPLPPPGRRSALAGLSAAARKIEAAASDDQALALTRGVDDPDDPGVPEFQSGSSSSMLGLAVGSYEETVARLATLDGQADRQTDAQAGPSGSGSYFGSFSDREAQATDDRAPAEAFDPADERPLYFLLRDGTMEGPLSMPELIDRADRGALRPTDQLQDRRSGKERAVRDLPSLSKLLATADERAQLRKFAQTRAAVRTEPSPKPIPSPPKDPRTRNTVLLILGVLLAFAAAAFWLLGR